jgi:diguanylate cyclase (GGDEF)-like protein
MDRRAQLVALISDPPIRERLLWRGLLDPDVRDSDDRAVTASAFGSIYGAGGIVGLVALAVGGSAITDPALMTGACAAALLISLICLLGYRRLPRRSFHLFAAAGVAIVTMAALASERGAEPVYAPFYAFVVMLSLLFFRALPATVAGVLATAAYGTLLYGRETPFATHLLLSSIAMLVALGVLIAIVRTRTARIAVGLAVDAHVDALTRIPNRRSFDERLELELERAWRGGEPLSVAICDLDLFKRVNDALGHEGGDRVLQRAARRIDATTRGADHAARIGGEEFALILPGTDPEQAVTAAERVRNAIKAEFEQDEPPLTISCGVASMPGRRSDGGRLFAAADRALYAAKRAGRDCTALASGEEIKVVAGGSAIGRLRQMF